MRKFIYIGLLITFCYSCSKDSNDNSKFIVKYEVQGSSEGYRIAYTNELGETVYTVGNSGWTYEVNRESGRCYEITIIPGSIFDDCDNTGTINIFFDDTLKTTKTVSKFTERVPDRYGLPDHCGLTISACN